MWSPTPGPRVFASVASVTRIARRSSAQMASLQPSAGLQASPSRLSCLEDLEELSALEPRELDSRLRAAGVSRVGDRLRLAQTISNLPPYATVSAKHPPFASPPDSMLLASRASQLTEGLWAQCIAMTLEVLSHLEKSRRARPGTVAFDIHALSYGRVIPGLFTPRHAADVDAETAKYVVDLIEAHDAALTPVLFAPSCSNFERVHRLFARWFTIPDEITRLVPDFDGDKTLGVHYRGTDKNADPTQANPLTANEFLNLVADQLSALPPRACTTIYAASDEDGFVEKVVKRFPRLEVISLQQDRQREGSNVGLFRRGASCCHEQPSPKSAAGMRGLQQSLARNAVAEVVALSLRASACSRRRPPSPRLQRCSTPIATSAAYLR